MRNFGQVMAVSTVPLLTALLQRHLVVLAILLDYQDPSVYNGQLITEGNTYPRMQFTIRPF